MLKHHSKVNNKVADVVSRVVIVFHFVKNSIVGFKRLKDEYSQCLNFGIIYKKSLDNPSPTQGDFLIRIGMFSKVLSCVFPVLHLEIS